MRTHHRHKVHKPKEEEPPKHKHKHKHESKHIKFVLPPIKWRPHHPRATAAGLLALFTAVSTTAGVTSGSWMSRPAAAANQERYYPTVSYGAARSCVLDHWAPEVQMRTTQQKWCSPEYPCDKVEDDRGGTLVPLKEACLANHARNGICWQYSVFSTCSGTWSDKLRYDHCLAIRSLCGTRVLTVFSSFTSFFSAVAGICSLLVTWERVGWLQPLCQSHRGELRTAHRWRLYRLRVLTRLVVLMRVCFGASFLCMMIVCIKFGVWTTKLQKVFAHETPSRPGGCAAVGDCPVLGPGFYYTLIAMGAAATGGVASMLQPSHKLGANISWEESFPDEVADGPPGGVLALTAEGQAAAREAEERERAKARQALEAADAADAVEGAAEAEAAAAQAERLHRARAQLDRSEHHHKQGSKKGSAPSHHRAPAAAAAAKPCPYEAQAAAAAKARQAREKKTEEEEEEEEEGAEGAERRPGKQRQGAKAPAPAPSQLHVYTVDVPADILRSSFAPRWPERLTFAPTGTGVGVVARDDPGTNLAFWSWSELRSWQVVHTSEDPQDMAELHMRVLLHGGKGAPEQPVKFEASDAAGVAEALRQARSHHHDHDHHHHHHHRNRREAGGDDEGEAGGREAEEAGEAGAGRSSGGHHRSWHKNPTLAKGNAISVSECGTSAKLWV
jgi:hypothetical protein